MTNIIELEFIENSYVFFSSIFYFNVIFFLHEKKKNKMLKNNIYFGKIHFSMNFLVARLTRDSGKMENAMASVWRRGVDGCIEENGHRALRVATG